MTDHHGINWLNDSSTILNFIKKLMGELDELKELALPLEEDEILFLQGEPLEYVYLLMEGEVKLTRTQPDKSDITLIHLEPGNFVGLIAFTTGAPTLTSARITKAGMALKMRPSQFEMYLSDHPRLKHPLQQLMLNNMIQRYKSNIRLQTKAYQLNKQITQDRNELKKAYKQLEETHQMLVHQEKMATLGELVAGFAHEVNNPASSLMRSAETLSEIYANLESTDAAFKLFEFGLESEPIDSHTLRQRMEKIKAEHPDFDDRSLLRKMAYMPDEALQYLFQGGNIHLKVQHFEAGKMIHNIRVASERIAKLVKSLKSYSRQDQNKEEMVDIREGIKDTLLVLSNRLKFVELNLHLDDIPKTCISVGDLNQVWTNILVNACDVLQHSGSISISTWHEKNNIIVEIADDGPGIPEEIMPKIFQPNFTTKNQGAEFGLGLGLAISSEIIQQAGGDIEAKNRAEGGAVFTITLPVREDC
ncbi:signal transduction histidine kinase [Gracilimonas mengyeensis]|uniref:histidine kinase n=2 Tax=Gracilimonas mengyeensis TaxID=1302730 RepID=A0A521FAT9_9BACT|nr:signal transduction histidine kinase [Gracilimonas mengyeensis]